MRPLLLLVSLPLWAADDIGATLQRLIEAETRNDKIAEQYTYVENREGFSIDKKGQAHAESSSKYEVIFVEGLAYKKLVERNGKPLSQREQSQVDKQMRQTAEYRREHERLSAPGGWVVMRSLFSRKSADFGSLDELRTLFDNRLAGEDEIRGHRVWIMESEPKQLGTLANEHEKQVLGFRKKFWIDQKEGVLVRAVYTVVATDSFLQPGSTLTFDCEKVDSDTWELVSLALDFSNSKEKPYRPTGRAVYRMDNFRKFDVQSTITLTAPNK